MNYVLKLVTNYKKNVFKSSCKSILTTSQLNKYIRYGDLVHDEQKEAFYLPIENEDDPALILYKRHNGILELYETVVPDHLRGYGIAKDLAKEVFDYVTKNELKIVLSCDYLQKYYRENPHYEGIVIHETDNNN